MTFLDVRLPDLLHVDLAGLVAHPPHAAVHAGPLLDVVPHKLQHVENVLLLLRLGVPANEHFMLHSNISSFEYYSNLGSRKI